MAKRRQKSQGVRMQRGADDVTYINGKIHYGSLAPLVDKIESLGKLLPSTETMREAAHLHQNYHTPIDEMILDVACKHNIDLSDDNDDMYECEDEYDEGDYDV